jgi:hypothetical protein
MKAVILAGGLGARLRPFTEAIPKPLLPIGEKAILEIQIDRLRKFGVTEVQHVEGPGSKRQIYDRRQRDPNCQDRRQTEGSRTLLGVSPQSGGPRPCLFQAGHHLCAASDILASQLGCNSSRVDNAAPQWQEGQ